MFFRSALDQFGAYSNWNPPSTIDWCEPNYAVSYYVAEWQNCFSSLTMTFGGLLAFWWTRKYEHPASLQAFALLIALVGVGSALFHGMLVFYSQMLDELPMLYATTGFYYIFINVAHQLGELKAQWWQEAISNANHPDHKLALAVDLDANDKALFLKDFYSFVPFYYISRWLHKHCRPLYNLFSSSLVLTLTLLMFIISIVHGYYGFVIVFQTFFGLLSFTAATAILQFCFMFNNSPGTKHFFYWRGMYIFGQLTALACWLFDNNFCTWTLTQQPIYLSWHALWHFFNYVSTYSAIVIACYCQQMTKNLSIDREFLIKWISTHPGKKISSSQLMLHPGDVREVDLIDPRFITPLSPLIGVENLKQTSMV